MGSRWDSEEREATRFTGGGPRRLVRRSGQHLFGGRADHGRSRGARTGDRDGGRERAGARRAHVGPVVAVVGSGVESARRADGPSGDRDDGRDTGRDFHAGAAAGSKRERAFAGAAPARRGTGARESVGEQTCPQPQALEAPVSEQRRQWQERGGAFLEASLQPGRVGLVL